MSRSIVIVIESLGGGGAQHVATTLANAWAANEVAVTVVTFQGPETDVFRLDPRIRRHVVGGAEASNGLLTALFANVRRVARIRQALRTSGAEVVLGFVGSTNILTILAAQGLGLRLIVSERNDPVLQSIGKVWDALRRLLYRRADLVVANSRAAVDAMRAYVPARRLLWLPNPLRTPPSAGPEVAIPLKRPFLLAVGRLSPAKGHDLLLTAFAQIHAAHPGLHLVILGDGRLRAVLETQARTLGIEKYVHFQGFMSDPFPWYRAALALIHPARFEGLPNVVLEAMSVGLPVAVSSAQAGLRDFVRDGESGLVVAADEPAAFAAAMSALATDAALRSRLAAAGREAVEPCEADRAIRSWSEALGLRVPA